MSRLSALALAAAAPAVWGSTYIVATETLAGWHPLTVAALRAAPAGLVLLLLVRRLPRGVWVWRMAALGALNFSVFWALLFVAAYRLPGGVAATVGAVQPLIVLGLARLALGAPVRPAAVAGGVAGLAGVALLTLAPGAQLDPVGIAAALGGALSMALGTVLTRVWRPEASALTVTAWQLAAGGALLAPAALLLAPAPPPIEAANLLGLGWLGLVGAALSYVAWFNGIGRLGPNAVAPLGLLSPASAALLGWLLMGETLSAAQAAGMALVFASVLAGALAVAARPSPPPAPAV